MGTSTFNLPFWFSLLQTNDSLSHENQNQKELSHLNDLLATHPKQSFWFIMYSSFKLGQTFSNRYYLQGGPTYNSFFKMEGEKTY